MSEPPMVLLDLEHGMATVIELGENCCCSFPRTCAEVNAQSLTYSRPCNFCLQGPPEPPVRRHDGLSASEAIGRIEQTEKAAAERFRRAVVSLVGEERSVA